MYVYLCQLSVFNVTNEDPNVVKLYMCFQLGLSGFLYSVPLRYTVSRDLWLSTCAAFWVCSVKLCTLVLNLHVCGKGKEILKV